MFCTIRSSLLQFMSPFFSIYVLKSSYFLLLVIKTKIIRKRTGDQLWHIVKIHYGTLEVDFDSIVEQKYPPTRTPPCTAFDLEYRWDLITRQCLNILLSDLIGKHNVAICFDLKTGYNLAENHLINDKTFKWSPNIFGFDIVKCFDNIKLL